MDNKQVEAQFLTKGNVYDCIVKYFCKGEKGLEVVVEVECGAPFKAIGHIKRENVCWNTNCNINDILYVGELIKARYEGIENEDLEFNHKALTDKPYDDSLYDLSTEELLKTIGVDSPIVIGCSKKSKYMFLENLYSADSSKKGTILIDPFLGKNISALVGNSNIEEGNYYKAQIELMSKVKRMERNQLFQFSVKTIQPIDNPYKEDVELTFKKQTSPSSNSSIANLLDEVGQNMYSSKDRMFFELLQNADDSSCKDGVSINIGKKDEYLIISHNGNCFSKSDFESITSAAKSTKTASKKKTGYKGIGFKSVFTNSQQVLIKSGGYQFEFNKDYPMFNDFDQFYFAVNDADTVEEQNKFLSKYASEKASFNGVKDIPWQLLPIWFEALPQELQKSQFDHVPCANVNIALKVGNKSILEYQKSIDALFQKPKFMLFLRNTKQIGICFDKECKHISKEDDGDFVLLKNSFGKIPVAKFLKKNFDAVPVSDEAFEEAEVEITKREKTNARGEKETKFYTGEEEVPDIPDRIASADNTTITFVAEVNAKDKVIAIKPNTTTSFYAFLPMNEQRFRFPFYINADFVLTSNREQLQGENPWNHYLMYQIGKCMVDWVAELATKNQPEYLNLLVSELFDEDASDTKELAHRFNSAYKQALEETPLVLNQSGDVVKTSEIMIDQSGLSAIIGADLFCQIMDNDKQLPSKDIDCNILCENLFGVEEVDDEDILCKICNESVHPIVDWFETAEEQSKTKFYNYLIDRRNIRPLTNNIDSIIKQLPIFKFGSETLSIDDLDDNDDYIIIIPKLKAIVPVLSKIGFVCSNMIDIQKHALKDYLSIYMPSDKDIFDKIVENDNLGSLCAEDKLKLFSTLKTLGNITNKVQLFANRKGELKPLSELMHDTAATRWLDEFAIDDKEYNQMLDANMVSANEVFEEIIVPNYAEILNGGVRLQDIFAIYRDQWTSGFTKKLIGDDDVETDLILPIVEMADQSAKIEFLDSSRSTLNLTVGKQYADKSVETRIIKMAAEVYGKEARDKFAQNSISINGESINEYAVSDDVLIKLEDKQYKMSLSDILPEYKGKSDVITQIFSQFKGVIKPVLESVFDLKPMSEKSIYDKISLSDCKTPTNSTNVFQYLFMVSYYRKRYNNCFNCLTIDNGNFDFVHKLLNVCFKSHITALKAEFSNLLKFHYFPNTYILNNEQLDVCLLKWADNVDKKRFLIEMGALGEDSDRIALRKAFLNNEKYNVDSLSLDTNEVKCFLDWALSKTKGETYKRSNQVTILKSMFSSLQNSSYKKYGYFTDKLNTAKEWEDERYQKWGKFVIKLYDGLMPYGGIYKGYQLFDAPKGDYYYYNTTLYVNKQKEIASILCEVINDSHVSFTKDDYNALFMVSVDALKEKDEEIKKLKEEITLLKSGCLSLRNEDGVIDNATASLGYASGLSKEQQIEANKEAKVAARKCLERLGYHFPENMQEYSTIDGVTKDNTEYPLVVKSYINQNADFRIGANEWLQLQKPNSILLVYGGGDQVGFLNFYDMIKSKDLLTISFDTQNIDKENLLDNFASLLHYFKDVHFNLNSVKQYPVSSELESLCFQEKRTESDLSSDSDSFL